MTRGQLATLEDLFRERDEARKQINDLQLSKGDEFEGGARLKGPRQEWIKFTLSRGFIGAQLIAQIIDIERRIRAAGGTL